MGEHLFNQYIREIRFERNEYMNYNQYPYSLPAIKQLETLEIHPKVTYIIGENGSGKSTLLESIAVAYGFNPEGGSKNFNFKTNETHSELHKSIKISKGLRTPKDGYFFRAESYYNLATNIDEIDYDGNLIRSYGGKSLHRQSHGESFISLILNRLNGHGVYIFDEPEAALSPMKQLVLLRRIHELVESDSQIIIATHSPILMSYPNAVIYDIENGYKKITYQETEHFIVTQNFLNDTDKMLEILLGDE